MNDRTDNIPLLFRFIRFLSNIAGVIGGLSIIIATLCIAEGVFVRYVFRHPTIWQIELAVYMLICATFIGSPWVLKERGHINIELIFSKLPERTKLYLNFCTAIVAFIFCVLVAWKGWAMWYEAYENNWVSESLWSIPLKYPYLIIPIGMTLTALQFIEIIYFYFKNLSRNSHKEEE